MLSVVHGIPSSRWEIMGAENHSVPLTHATLSPSKEEIAWAAPKQSSSKFLVHLLTLIVIVCAIVLLVSIIAKRTKTPIVELRFVGVKNLSHSSKSLNVTLEAELAIKNNNFAGFSYQNSSLQFLYHGLWLGERKAKDGRVEAGGEKVLKMEVVCTSSRLYKQINTTKLSLTSHAIFHGRVSVIGVVMKIKAWMNCTMNLVLRYKLVEDLICN